MQGAVRRSETVSVPHEAVARANKPSGWLRLAGPASLLLLSGAAALVYQVLWIKQLSLIVGVEVHAVSIGVAAFFAGLAVGGWIFGRLADRFGRPWVLYACLEAAAALLGVGATLALGVSAMPFARLESQVGALAWVLPLLLVAVPATLLGGTLPVLMRAVQPVLDEVAQAGGRLYAANTCGAIGGTLLAAFCFIPWFGVRGSAIAAAVLNLLVAGGALLLDRRSGPAGSDGGVESAAASAQTEPTMSTQARWALALYAIAGGLALGYEVVWSQAIVQFTSTRSFAFAVVLATYLAGLVLGSALIARRVERLRDPWSVFAWLISAAGGLALLELTLLGPWLLSAQSAADQAVRSLTGNTLAGLSARFAVAGLSIVFVPTLLLGAAFPVVLRLAVDTRRVGSGVGAVLALNTLGGIAGTVLAGFVLVPALGLVYSLAVLAVAACAVGLAAVFAGQGVGALSRIGVAALAVLVFGSAWMAPSDRLAQLLTRARGGTLDFYEESHGATVAVIKQHNASNTFHRLYIQGVSNSGDAMTSMRYMRLQALLPLIVHSGEPRSALVIGMGTGITAGALLAYPGLQERVVAELLPAVVRAVPRFDGNYRLWADPRMQVRLRDGRRELMQSDQRYDLITLEPPPPSAAGVVNLYSTDFYRLAAQRLQRGGMVAQWLPLPTQNDEDTRSLVQSFLAVFPHATLWTTELHEMMLVGSMQPIVLDTARIAERFAQPQVQAALAEVGVASPAALLATWVGGRTMLERYAGSAPEVTDDRPRIEYAGWVRRAEFPQQLTALLDGRTVPPLVGGNAALMEDITRERQILYRFYSAGLNAYMGQREEWARDIQEVARFDPDNPYYRWFLGANAR